MSSVVQTAARDGLKLVGTPRQVADCMEEWFTSGATDGFMLEYVYPSLEQFVIAVVPELQRRGRFRKDYTGPTLRDHLGLARPRRGEWPSRASR